MAALLPVLGGAVPQAARPQGSSRHVALISLDGFPSWALDDPSMPVPTLRKLAESGAVASAMRPVNPSVTWPNHTTLVSGVTPAKHQVLYNGLLKRDTGVPPRIEPWVPREQMVRAPTLYDVAHASGMTTAQVDWVAIQAAPTITWEFPERPAPDGQIAQELVKAGTLTQAELEAFATRNIVWRDRIWTDAAVHILEKHRPNLMLFHLLSLDSVQHRYGPRTLAATATMALLDAHVAQIVAAVERAGMTPRTTFFVVSDHGFRLVKRQIRLNTAFARAGLVTLQDGKITAAKAYAVPEGGSAIVFLTVPDPTGELLTQVRKAIVDVEGVASLVEPSEYARLGLPQPTASDQMGVLFVTPKDGYSFTAPATGEVVVDAPEGGLGAHGYPATDPELGALFIASGAGIRPGVRFGPFDNVDVAPTMAELLGLTLANADGKPLKQILQPARVGAQ